jgi:hypothetical protein
MNKAVTFAYAPVSPTGKILPLRVRETEEEAKAELAYLKSSNHGGFKNYKIRKIRLVYP